MSVRPRFSLARPGTAIRLILLVLISIASFAVLSVDRAVAAADPGVVQVDGYQWKKAVPIRLDTLTGTQETINGEPRTTYSLLEILEAAEPRAEELDVAALVEAEVVFADASGKATLTGDQIRNQPDRFARFFVGDSGFTVLRVPGQDPSRAEFEYELQNAEIYVPKVSKKQLKVSITPRSKTVKGGTKVSFAGSIQSGLPAGVTPTFSWTVDGAPQSSKSSRMTYRFDGKEGTQRRVLLNVSALGANDDPAIAVITISKSKKPEKKKEEPKDKGNNPTTNNSDPGGGYGDPYGDGYGDGYGYGDDYGNDYGNDYGSTSPGISTPSVPSPPVTPKAKPKPEVKVDDGLMPVRGELLDPSIPAEVIDPATEQPATENEVSPSEAKSGGFGLSGGAMTAIGIGVLLGFGGFAELRTFTRFR